MRARATPLVVSGFLGGLVALFWLVYRGQTTGAGAADPRELASTGRNLFDWVVLSLLLAVVFLVPGVAAGAIAGERERQTLLPLQSTLLGARRIVTGKVAASLALLALLVLASSPVLVLAWVAGGAGAGDVAAGVAVVLAAGVTVTCVAIGCSALTRRVQSATVSAYVLTLVLVGGTLGLYQVVDPGVAGDDDSPPALLLAVNPVAVLAAATAPPLDSAAASADSPLASIRTAVAPMAGEVDGGSGERPDTADTDDTLDTRRSMSIPFAGAWEPVTATRTDSDVEVADDDGSTADDGARALDEQPRRRDYSGFLALAGASASVMAGLGLGVAMWRLRIPAKVER
jgi:hypothetical protein